MRRIPETQLAMLVDAAIGTRSLAILSALEVPLSLSAETGRLVPRAVFAMALNVVLFAGLLDRVPTAAAYVDERVRAGGRICFDHGALRTIRFADGPTGGLPAGEAAFTRILVPLGYVQAGTYPLPALRMTGRAYVHADLPQTIPQFFLSELHVDRFDAAFGAVAARLFATSRDPLGAAERSVLDGFAAAGAVPLDDAVRALPGIAAAFGCHHAPPEFADYETLRAHSAEAAWIATEGNAFNHATDRVDDVDALAARLRAAGWPMKDRIEVSASGRVRQTALRADTVARTFADGAARDVPGSFYEFISRSVDPETGSLDLSFDSGNAAGIFAMTRTT